MGGALSNLIDLRDCKPVNLVWVFGLQARARRKVGPARRQLHLYQFGLVVGAQWSMLYPPVMPVCRAPGYRVIAYERWKDSDFESPAKLYCHACITQIVHQLPHIFLR